MVALLPQLHTHMHMHMHKLSVHPVKPNPECLAECRQRREVDPSKATLAWKTEQRRKALQNPGWGVRRRIEMISKGKEGMRKR